MGKISFLSKTLQNQIAAGEVVERPASVIKELIENSIDAGAKNISLEIEKGGIKKIRVIDDGEGMDKEDIILSFKRYATSKISSVDDLFSIRSFGFRGEAIASIASVSNFTIRTKTENSQIGYESINGEAPYPCSCPKGTEMLVENLFWNVPARRKFLKSENTESREIIKLVESIALANPHIGFKLKKDQKEYFHFLPENIEDIKEAQKKRCKKVLGNSIAEFFLPLEFLGKEIKISGFCTHPNFHRANRDRQFFFVNRRIVTSDKNIQSAISQSYHTLIPKGKFPAFVLFLDLPPEKVDVNVHPRKTEVRFHSPSEIFHITKSTFLSSLSQEHSQISPNANPQQNILNTYNTSPFSSTRTSSFHHSPQSVSFSSHTKIKNITPFPNHTHRQQNIFSDNEEKNLIKKNYTIIGQIRKSFIIREEEDGIRIIDQHAAHERVRYEKLLRDFRAKKITSQPLLTPIVFSLSLSEKNLLLEKKEILTKLGFEIEDFGGQEISILSVPTGNTKIDIEKLFRSLLDDLDSFDPLFRENISSFAEKILSYTACRGAIKFGDTLNFLEIESLLNDWDRCTHPESCAHGRPVSTFFPYKMLENECGRY